MSCRLFVVHDFFFHKNVKVNERGNDRYQFLLVSFSKNLNFVHSFVFNRKCIIQLFTQALFFLILGLRIFFKILWSEEGKK